jgi:hypothetical protein
VLVALLKRRKNMDITILIDLLPDSVKNDVVDFNDVLLKNRKNAIRVLMDRILTEEEKQEMKKNKHFMGVDCVAQYRYAPEIKKSYFYVV